MTVARNVETQEKKWYNPTHLSRPIFVVYFRLCHKGKKNWKVVCVCVGGGGGVSEVCSANKHSPSWRRLSVCIPISLFNSKSVTTFVVCAICYLKPSRRINVIHHNLSEDVIRQLLGVFVKIRLLQWLTLLVSGGLPYSSFETPKGHGWLSV